MFKFKLLSFIAIIGILGTLKYRQLSAERKIWEATRNLPKTESKVIFKKLLGIHGRYKNKLHAVLLLERDSKEISILINANKYKTEFFLNHIEHANHLATNIHKEFKENDELTLTTVLFEGNEYYSELSGKSPISCRSSRGEDAVSFGCLVRGKDDTTELGGMRENWIHPQNRMEKPQAKSPHQRI